MLPFRPMYFCAAPLLSGLHMHMCVHSLAACDLAASRPRPPARGHRHGAGRLGLTSIHRRDTASRASASATCIQKFVVILCKTGDMTMTFRTLINDHIYSYIEPVLALKRNIGLLRNETIKQEPKGLSFKCFGYLHLSA
jgi:hypothetical protein